MNPMEDRARALATRKLSLPPVGVGQLMVLKVKKGSTRNRDTQTVAVAATPHETTGLEELTEVADLPGTLVKAGDIKVMLSPVKTDGTDLPEPSAQDLLEVRGKDRTIIKIAPYQPMGRVIYTYAWVR